MIYTHWTFNQIQENHGIWKLFIIFWVYFRCLHFQQIFLSLVCKKFILINYYKCLLPKHLPTFWQKKYYPHQLSFSAITLRNNLKTLFLTEGNTLDFIIISLWFFLNSIKLIVLFLLGRMYSWFTRHLIFPLLALVPPIAVAFVTNSLEFLVGITGSYAGAGIQYVVPALLVYFGRSASVNAIGVG